MTGGRGDLGRCRRQRATEWADDAGDHSPRASQGTNVEAQGRADPTAGATPTPLRSRSRPAGWAVAPARHPAGSEQRHNLPGQLTSFVGREQEIAELTGLLATARLVTLTAVGGIGKTRLALELAASLLDTFPDGAWLVDLAPLAEPALVPRAVAATLGLRGEPGRPLADTLSDYLRVRELLLVLDNCEHLVTACAELAETLLRACPRLRILATSREALNAAGEVTWRVPPLSLPTTDDGRRTTDDPEAVVRRPSSVVESEAVRLFLERATAALPGFGLTDRNAGAVAEICHRLDGIPLAIELAAARVKVLAPEQIAARLDDRFRLLAGGRRTAPPRHQTLRALVDWSYSLLSEPERILLRRLSLFAGGWSLEAAEAICAGDEVEADEVLDLLARLVDKSLVLAEERDGETRYRLLETLRQYAAEKLREAGEEAVSRRRHRDWFLEFAEAGELGLRTADHPEWLKRLELEHDNLRVALAWSWAEPGGAAAGARLAGALWWFWHLHGHAVEGLDHLERALAAGEAVPAAVRAKVLNGTGFLIYDRGDFGPARPLVEEALALSREVGDTWSIGYALGSLGFVHLFQGDPEGAVPLLEEGLHLARQAGDLVNIARLLNNLGVVAHTLNEHQRAIPLIEESLDLWRTLRAKGHIAMSLFLLGRIAHFQGDVARATTLLDESVVLSRESGYSRNTGYALQALARVARTRGDLARALALSKESLALRRDLKAKTGILECLEDLAGLAQALGDLQRAARLFGAAEALHEAIGWPPTPATRARYESDLAAVRAALDEATLASAWDKGRAMPLDEAIEDALATEPGTPVEPSSAGKPVPLTPREREVAVLVARGLSNLQIADALVISNRTAETHVASILGKLGLRSRAQIATWAIEHGLVAEGNR